MTRYWSRHAVTVVVAALLLMSQQGPVQAQSPTLGSVWGVTVDEAGVPVSGVLVTLTEVTTGLTWETSSDRLGEFRFRLLHAGDYRLRVERIGHAPKEIEGIPVRTGRNLRLTASLGSAAGAALEVERYVGASPALGRPGSSLWVPQDLAAVMPAPQRDVSELARLTSRSTDDLVVEGLPAMLSAIAIDGTPFRPAAHPHVRATPYRTTGFSLAGISSAQLVTNELDVEWGGVAGATLSALSRRGTPDLTAEARASWSGSVLPGPSFMNGSSETYNDLQGSAAIRGPVSDSARFSMGVELRRLETPVARAWPESAAAAELVTLGQAAGLNLEAYRRAGVAPAEALTGFARLDWPLLVGHRFGGWVQYASLPRVSGFDPRTATIPELDGSDLLAGVSLTSMLRGGMDNDLRVSYTSSRRATAALSSVTATTIVGEDLSFGGMTSVVAGEESRLMVSNAMHFRSGLNTLKLGGDVTLAAHRYDHREGAAGEYFFGGLDQLAARTGAFVRTEGSAAAADWTTATLALFAQNRWRAAEGVELVVGLRAEREPLPTDNVRLDEEWQRLTGIANNETDALTWRPAARVGVSWDVQGSSEWVLHADGGMYYDRIDPLLLAQWQTDDGGGRVRREVGPLSWPQPPAGGALRTRLTALGPGFEPPLTSRLSAGLTHALSADAAVHVSAVIRRTENLPRNTDRNLPAAHLPAPAFSDQYGRPVFGTLVQHGGLLAAVPGSNRRFDDYDEVSYLTADGWSNHWGLTLGYRRAVDAGIGVVAEYTYGSTTDNWFAARHGGWTIPLPQGLDATTNWVEGPSDFDVPHRAVAGVVAAAPFGGRVSALYRFQSGMPFTPGFRAGVDASGDGSFRNDPAFIDASLPGMVELMNEWPCLRESSGAMAARNSCRAASVHAIDVSAGVEVFRFGTGVARVMIDVFDLLESERAAPDAALYLVDPSRQLVVDERRVDVPLLVNTNFGEELSRPHSGRRVRLGFLVNW
jgi:hypothetical protein